MLQCSNSICQHKMLRRRRRRLLQHTGERIPAGFFISLVYLITKLAWPAAVSGLSWTTTTPSVKSLGNQLAQSWERNVQTCQFMVFIATCKRNAGWRFADCWTYSVFPGKQCNMLVTNIVTPSEAVHFNLTPHHISFGCRVKTVENWRKCWRNKKKEIEKLNAARTMILRQFQRLITAWVGFASCSRHPLAAVSQVGPSTCIHFLLENGMEWRHLRLWYLLLLPFGQLLTALHLQAMLLDVDEPASKCLATPTANGSAFCPFW